MCITNPGQYELTRVTVLDMDYEVLQSSVPGHLWLVSSPPPPPPPSASAYQRGWHRCRL